MTCSGLGDGCWPFLVGFCVSKNKEPPVRASRITGHNLRTNLAGKWMDFPCPAPRGASSVGIFMGPVPSG